MKLFAKDVMQQEVKSVCPDLPLTELDRRFVEEKVSGFPVVNDGKICGVVSASDILRKIEEQLTGSEIDAAYYSGDSELDAQPKLDEWIAANVGKRLGHLCVRNVMHEEVHSVSQNEPLQSVAKLMSQKKIHRVLVVDDDRLVGIISTADIARICGANDIDISLKQPEALDF